MQSPQSATTPRRLTLANTLGEHTLDLTLSKLLMVKIGHTIQIRNFIYFNIDLLSSLQTIDMKSSLNVLINDVIDQSLKCTSFKSAPN